MAGFFGQIAQAAGQNLVEGQQFDLRQAQVQEEQQKVAMGKMSLLSAQQKQQGIADVSAFLKGQQAQDSETFTNPLKSAQAYERAAGIAARDGNFEQSKQMSDLANGKRKDAADAALVVANKRQETKETLGSSASDYLQNPTPEAGAVMVKNAVLSGMEPKDLPKPDSSSMAMFAKLQQTAGLSGKEKLNFIEKQTEFAQNKEVQKQNHEDSQRNFNAQLAQSAAAQAGVREDRQERQQDREDARKAKLTGAGMTAQQSGVNNQVITASTEATRSLVAMGRENLGVTVGAYSDLHNNTLTSATAKAFTTNITTDEQRNMAVKSGGAALEMSRALTLGAGRSANNAQIDEIKKMITPVVGDTRWNALIKQVNAIEILKVRAETTPESRDPKVRAAQIENEKVLNSYPSLIQVENAMKKEGLGKEFNNEQGNFNDKLARIKADINKNPQETKSGHPADIEAILAKPR